MGFYFEKDNRKQTAVHLKRSKNNAAYSIHQTFPPGLFKHTGDLTSYLITRYNCTDTQIDMLNHEISS